MRSPTQKKTGAAIAIASVLGLGGGGLGLAGLQSSAPPDDFTRQMAAIVLNEAQAQAQARMQSLVGSPAPGAVEAITVASAASLPHPLPGGVPEGRGGSSPSPTITPEDSDPETEAQEVESPPTITDEDFDPPDPVFAQPDPDTEAAALIPPPCPPCPPTAEAFRIARRICAADTNTGMYSLAGTVYDCTTDKPASQ